MTTESGVKSKPVSTETRRERGESRQELSRVIPQPSPRGIRNKKPTPIMIQGEARKSSSGDRHKIRGDAGIARQYGSTSEKGKTGRIQTISEVDLVRGRQK
jgi:hypothetical protein